MQRRFSVCCLHIHRQCVERAQVSTYVVAYARAKCSCTVSTISSVELPIPIVATKHWQNNKISSFRAFSINVWHTHQHQHQMHTHITKHCEISFPPVAMYRCFILFPALLLSLSLFDFISISPLPLFVSRNPTVIEIAAMLRQRGNKTYCLHFWYFSFIFELKQ